MLNGIALKKECKVIASRIFSDSGQPASKKASSERARFIKLYPETESYLQFDTPNYKVYVGDFRTKSDAYAFLVKIKAEFPKAFLVEQKINLSQVIKINE